MVQETYTVEEDPQESPPFVSVETNEDGTTQRTETSVTNLWKMDIYITAYRCSGYTTKRWKKELLCNAFVCSVTVEGFWTLRFKLYIQ